jgi:uroporphyrinogen decarboxylase
MNRRENVDNCIKLKKCDFVPIALHNFLVCAELMKMPYGEIFTDGKLIARSQIKAYEIFNHDILMVEVGIATLAEACGCAVEYPDREAPWIKKPLLEKISDARYLEVPDMKKAGHIPEMLKAINILKKEIGDEVYINGRADQGPFSLAAELAGMNNFLLALGEEKNEEDIKMLMDYTRKVHLSYAIELAKAGSDFTSMGESLAGPDVVSPLIYRKYAFPFEKEHIEQLNKRGIPIASHICGNVDSIIEDFISTGANIIEIDEKTDFKKAKKLSIGKCCILGIVSPRLLKMGSPGEVEKETIETLSIGKEGYNFILGAGCAIPGSTPIENIKKMVEIGRELGKY